MEGTLSVGVYDRSGRLVRVLRQEAPIQDFTATLNGLVAFWDGRDDQGIGVPAGKYRVRGFASSEGELVGEAFHGNDWVLAEDSPRPVRFLSLSVEGAEVV